MKSRKYRTFVRSKVEYPTRLVKGSGSSKGGITVGHIAARRDIERALGRPLAANTQIRTAGGNWKFLEPRLA